MLRDIKIKSVLNGWIVDVGCSTVVFTDIDSMLGNLEAYLKDPEGVEKRFLEGSVNSEKLGPSVACGCDVGQVREGVDCPPAYRLDAIG